MTGWTLAWGEMVVTTVEGVINEELVFMTDDKFSNERKFSYDEEWKVIERIALCSLAVGIVGIAVNVFSIDGEHWLLKRPFSCRGAFGLPLLVRLVETPAAAVPRDTAAIDLHLKPAASLLVSRAIYPNLVPLAEAAPPTLPDCSSRASNALEARCTPASVAWAISLSLPSGASVGLEVNSAESQTSLCD